MKLGMFYSKVEDAEADLKWIAGHGFDAVVAGDDADFQAAARRHGLAAWACMHTFAPPGEEQDFLCVDVHGKRHKWFSSACPNHPAVREACLKRYRQAASRRDVAGLLMDGVRFASPSSGLEAFCTCFCDHCAKAAAGLALNFARMKQDVTELYEHLKAGQPPVDVELADSPLAVLGRVALLPGVADWLWFRQRIIADFVATLSKVVRGQGKRLGGYLFSPCLAGVVGQDYAALAPHIDLAAPMLYRNLNERGSIAPVNTELHTLASWATTVNDPSWVLKLAGLPPQPIKNRDDLLAPGLSPEAMRIETARARALIGKTKPLAPILWWDDSVLAETMDAARAGGATGVQVFLFTPGVKNHLK